MITIAWDVDDVLNDVMRCWLEQKWKPEHPGCTVAFEQITQNTPERILKSTKEEYLTSLDDFRLSGLYAEMKPDPVVLEWFKKNGHKARHIVFTAVPTKAAQISAAWVMKNFGRWIRSFNFVPSPREAGEVLISKAQYLKWFGKADVLIEDNEQNVYEAEKIGVKGILVSKPWNKSRIGIKEALTQIL